MHDTLVRAYYIVRLVRDLDDAYAAISLACLLVAVGGWILEVRQGRKWVLPVVCAGLVILLAAFLHAAALLVLPYLWMHPGCL